MSAASSEVKNEEDPLVRICLFPPNGTERIQDGSEDRGLSSRLAVLVLRRLIQANAVKEDSVRDALDYVIERQQKEVEEARKREEMEGEVQAAKEVGGDRVATISVVKQAESVGGSTDGDRAKKSQPHGEGESASEKGTNRTKVDASFPSSSGKVVSSQQQTKRLSAHRTRHIALRFLYDGSTYSGYAENVGLSTDNSVERTLFGALQKTCLIESRDTCQYSRCGRTDRGVSAFGQVIALKVRSAIPLGAKLVVGEEGKEEQREVKEEDLPKNERESLHLLVPQKKTKKKQKKKKGKKRPSTEDDAEESMTENSIETFDGQPTTGGDDGASPSVLIAKTVSELSYPRLLNNVLPPAVRILGWSPVSDEFSARFSASTRTYRYYFIKRNLKLSKMNEALALLIGRHDFRNFCKMDVEKVYNFERVLHSAKIVTPDRSYPGDQGSRNGEEGDDDELPYRTPCHFEFVGQAFLWHQIRCIVSILFLIGAGLEKPSVISDLFDIETNPGKPSYDLAPDLPLVLHGCGYRNLVLGYSTKNLWNVSCDLEAKWEELALAAERVRDAIASLKTEFSVTRKDVKEFVTERKMDRKRKGRRLRERIGNGGDEQTMEVVDNIEVQGADEIVPWSRGLGIIESALGIRPNPSGPRELIHVPLLERSRGTTYEEKVQSIMNSGKGGNGMGKEDDLGGGSRSRKRERYEENVVRKRKSPEEDAEFYDRMLRQGGTGV